MKAKRQAKEICFLSLSLMPWPSMTGSPKTQLSFHTQTQHRGCASQRVQQYSWRRRPGERSPERVSGFDGRCDQTARLVSEHSKVSADGGSSEGQTQPCSVPRGVADACENGHQHRKHGWLQQ